MIKFTAQNFGCLKNFEIELQPLHALIGPNDSGKSTVLRALECGFAFGGGSHALPLLYQVLPYLPRGLVRVGIDSSGFEVQPDGTIVDVFDGTQVGNISANVSTSQTPRSQLARTHRLPETTPVIVRLTAERLREPSKLIPDVKPLRLGGVDGAALAGIYDALNNRNPDGAQEIRARVRELFPTVDRLQLTNVNDNTKAFSLLLRDGTKVAADSISEGLLYYLAFAILPYLDEQGPFLIEEPENGLHPARIREVMNVLKEVSKTSQVVIATHSPLVINELEPDQVSIITRDPETGSKATPMTMTKNFRERAGVYALGELWLSYADGEMEKDLVGDDA